MKVSSTVAARAVLAAALLAAGCRAPAGGSAPGRAAPSGPVIAVAKGLGSYPTAALSGRLVLRAGCLLVRGRVLVWPSGTSWDSGRRAVVPPAGPPVELGAQFRGGGGSYAADTDFEALLGSAAVAHRIATCMDRASASAVWLVAPS